MQNDNYKWLIPSDPLNPLSSEQEIEMWNETHSAYSEQVFSATQDFELCRALIHPSDQFHWFNIPNSPDAQILIPGCGSEIYLQKTLLDFCPQIGKVYSTDFSKIAVELARASWYQAHDNLDVSRFKFAEADSTRLTNQKPDWQSKFDYVLVVNSVVTDDDVKNRQMLREFYAVLKPGGKLYGIFPSIFWYLEVAHLEKSKAGWLTDGTVSLLDSALYDKKYNDRQIFYTPLRLKRIFKEIGFKLLSFEIIFGNSISTMNVSKIYDIDEPDILDWQFLVRLEKEKL